MIKVFLFLLLFVVVDDMSNEKAKAESFSLKDQFGNLHRIKFPREKVLILAFADRDGSGQLEGWIRSLYERYKIDIYGVAELSSVPTIIRGVVRSFIRQRTKNPVMLDWEGDVSRLYGYEKGKANIYVISKEGLIVMRRNGAASQEALEEAFKKIDELLS